MAVLMITTVIVCICCVNNPKIYKKEIKTKSLTLMASFTDKELGELVHGNNAEQTFLATDNHITSVSIGFAAYDRENEGNIIVELWDKEKNSIVETWEKDVSRISGYYYTTFYLSKSEVHSKDRLYSVKIYSRDKVFGKGLSVHYRPSDDYKEGILYYNGKQVEGNMMLSVGFALDKPIVSKNLKSILYFWMWVFYCISLFCAFSAIGVKGILMIWRRRTVIKNSWKKIFGYAGISLGVSIVLSYCLQYLIHGAFVFHWVYMFWIFIFLVAWKFGREYIKSSHRNPEFFFLTVSLLVGLGMAITLPVATSITFDDDIHYNSVYSYSYFISTKKTVADQYMAERVYVEAYEMNKVKEIWKELNASYYGNNNVIETSVCSYDTLFSTYNRMAYGPAVIMHFLGRAMHLPFVMIFILGRIANVLLYSTVVYLGLKQMKKGKYLLMSVALLPHCMFQAANYDYDYWLNGFMCLAIACVFGIIQQNEKATNRQLALLLGAFAVGVSPKAIYVLLMLLVALIPKERFLSVKQRRVFYCACLCVCVVIVGMFMVPFIVHGPGVGDVRGGVDVNSTLQVAFIMKHPWTYTKILLKFLFGSYFSYDRVSTTVSIFGYLRENCFGGICLLFALFFVLLDYPEKKIMSLIQRIGVAVLIFGNICAIATVFYITYTKVASEEIMGCQGRYMIPFLFPFLFLIGNHQLTLRLRKVVKYELYEKVFCYETVIVLFMACFLSYILDYH